MTILSLESNGVGGSFRRLTSRSGIGSCLSLFDLEGKTLRCAGPGESIANCDLDFIPSGRKTLEWELACVRYPCQIGHTLCRQLSLACIDHRGTISKDFNVRCEIRSGASRSTVHIVDEKQKAQLRR